VQIIYEHLDKKLHDRKTFDCGETVALLNHNKPTAYIVPAKTYARMLELIDDADLLNLAKERLKEEDSAIDVDIHDL